MSSSKSFYSLASRPFMTVPRVGSFHPSPDATKAIDGLCRVVKRAEGIGLLVGPTGCGKSLLLSCLRERLEGDYAVAILSGARICTRRGLWQSILSDLDEAYRGLDEEELRIGLVDRIRGLAATGSGLVVLVDESHTLPRRLLEELRLLTGVVTAYPAVHLVLAGTIRLEEMLGESDLEGIAQRIAVRGYLEALDYEETCRYVRTQMYCAGLDWDTKFEPECDAVVFSLTEGVPRLINQLCDQAMRLAEQRNAENVGKHDLASAWEEIQCLPAPASLQSEISRPNTMSNADELEQIDASLSTEADYAEEEVVEESCFGNDTESAIIEFGSFEEEAQPDDQHIETDGDTSDANTTLSFAERSSAESYESQEVTEKQQREEDEPSSVGFEESQRATEFAVEALIKEAQQGLEKDFYRNEELKQLSPFQKDDLCLGSDIELVFDPPFDSEDEAKRPDPFAECFAEEEEVVERFVMEGPDDFHRRLHVASREGLSINRQLSELSTSESIEKEQKNIAAKVKETPPSVSRETNQHVERKDVEAELDDSDMVVIEEDRFPDPNSTHSTVAAVRLSDYSRLFARLRRGGRMGTSSESGSNINKNGAR